MTDCLYIRGANGGAGATTFTYGTGIALALKGERTLLVDGDYKCGALTVIAGLDGMNVYTLSDVRSGACRVKQTLLQHPISPNLYILPTFGCADFSFTEKCVKEISELFDFVLCDNAAPGACNRAILVSETNKKAAVCAKIIGAELKDSGFKQVALAANKVNGGLIFDGTTLTPQELSSLTGCELQSVIPEDLLLPINKMKKGTRKAFAITAESLIKNDGEVYKVLKQYSGFKGLIKRRLRTVV